MECVEVVTIEQEHINLDVWTIGVLRSVVDLPILLPIHNQNQAHYTRRNA